MNGFSCPLARKPRLDACPRCGTLKPHWQELCRSCLRASRELKREEIHRTLLENQQRLREERACDSRLD